MGAIMLTRRIIPCLDVAAGRVVKGVRFENIRDAGDPVALAQHYAITGADELVMLDITATIEKRETMRETVRHLREVLDIPLTVGGGVREMGDAENLLMAGADKVSVNSAAVTNPAMITAMAQHFGRQCTVLAIDAKKNSPTTWEVMVQGGRKGTGMDVVTWARDAVARGAGEILLTSLDRDGTQQGYDLELLRAVSAAVHVPVIASGGAAHVMHMVDAFGAGADAVLAASIFHDGHTTPQRVKAELSEQGIRVRL